MGKQARDPWEFMNIILGVAGGIAAYKSPEIVRRLKDAGHEVRVVMTAAAEAFVTPLTFQAVSGEPVHRDTPRRDGGGRDGPYRARPLGGRGARRPGHREPDGAARAWLRGQPAHHRVPRDARSHRPRAGHEPADVAHRRDPRPTWRCWSSAGSGSSVPTRAGRRAETWGRGG